MTRRKGELSERQILRQWPHHVALAAEAVRGLGHDPAVFAMSATSPVYLRLRKDRGSAANRR